MLGDGEHINNVIHTGSMDDVGTRLRFLTELYELWQTGIDILERYDKHKPNYEEEKKKLENARDMLYFHMTKDYKSSVDAVRINTLPKNAEDIKDETKTE